MVRMTNSSNEVPADAQPAGGASLKDRTRTDDFAYLEPYQKLTIDDRLHSLDGSSAPRSPEELTRQRQRTQTLFVVVICLILFSFFLTYFILIPMFGTWVPSTPAEELLEDAIYILIYSLILLIPAFILFYIAIRWVLYRLYAKRVKMEYEAEVKALGIQEAKSSNKNLCNSCYRLIEKSAQKCPFCGAEIDTKLPYTKEPEESKISLREFFGRLAESAYISLSSSLRLVPLVFVLIIVLGTLFNILFDFFHIGLKVQTVLLWGSLIVGFISIMCSTTLPTGKFLSAPYLWRYTVPVARKESATSIEVVRARWLIMAGFCFLIFLVALTVPF